MSDETCPACNRLTREGLEKRAKDYQKRPIYGTDFSRPLSALVEDVRNQLSYARGRLYDIRAANPGLSDRVQDAEGALTCCISFLYNTMKELQESESRLAATEAAKKDVKAP